MEFTVKRPHRQAKYRQFDRGFLGEEKCIRVRMKNGKSGI